MVGDNILRNNPNDAPTQPPAEDALNLVSLWLMTSPDRVVPVASSRNANNRVGTTALPGVSDFVSLPTTLESPPAIRNRELPPGRRGAPEGQIDILALAVVPANDPAEPQPVEDRQAAERAFDAVGAPQAASEAQPEAKPPRLRLGVDFEAQAPVAADLIGTRYLETEQNRVPLQVRENIVRSIDQLRSPDAAIREQAQQRLRDFGPAAVPFLISQLDNANWRHREAAHAQLLQMGDAALPGMLSTLDGTHSPEMRNRLNQLIDTLAPLHEGDVLDAQGRLRRSHSLGGESLAISYDAQGRLSHVSVDRRTGTDVFVREADGTFRRGLDRYSLEPTPIRNLSVGQDGTISFGVGTAAVTWSRAGNVSVTGSPVTADFAAGVMTVPVRTGDSITNVSVLPMRYPDPGLGGK